MLAGCEGVLIASRDVVYLTLSYFVLGLSFLAYQSFVRSNALGVHAVWIGFFLFQWARFVAFGSRVMWKAKKKMS